MHLLLPLYGRWCSGAKENDDDDDDDGLVRRLAESLVLQEVLSSAVVVQWGDSAEPSA